MLDIDTSVIIAIVLPQSSAARLLLKSVLWAHVIIMVKTLLRFELKCRTVWKYLLFFLLFFHFMSVFLLFVLHSFCQGKRHARHSYN